MKGYYFIFDKVSKAPYGEIIPCKNDAVAVLGFKQFLEKQENAKPEYFELRRMCTVDEDLQVLDKTQNIVCFGQDVDSTFEKLLQENFE